ncbi:alpha/beta hydrolase [Niveispirillum sp.]|uniref:alpha/beta fold hydrolase n=1 Tax=Niveispirillum sp. TaxID=1917217 RepID=UPI001B484B80|nr:alpha/beta hydrolase [Niveispirillum sp.]MBP7336834.1 alpha/beta hydrolase [Niveispirillum sp.]
MSMSIAEFTAATSRGPLHYADAGEGPAVLSLHGAMGGIDQGMILARVTGADAGRVIAPARPGYPGTPLSSGKTPEAQADLYAALLDHLGLEKVAVIAVSGGGASALMFALRHPDRCRGLVLVSTCAGPDPMPIPAGFGLMVFLARWPAFVRWMKARALRNADRISARSIPEPEQREALLADPVAMPLYRQLRVGMFDRLAERLPGTANDIDVTRRQRFALAEIGAPTLVVHGTGDPLLSYERHGLELARRIPGADLLTVEGGGHAAIFTHRALIAPRVAAFLAGL